MPLTGAVAPSRSMRTALARSMCNYARFHGSNSSLLAQQAVAPQRQGLQRSHHRTIWNLAKGFGLGFAGKPTETLSKRPPLKPGKVAPKSVLPAHIPKPPYADNGKLPGWDERHQVHNAQQIEKMRAAGKLAATVLAHAGTLVKPGVTTDEIDQVVHKMIIDAGAYPSPLNYGKFPKSVCTSVNECVCHGIPDSRPLEEGDIVNIDVTVFLDGHHGDTSRMFYAGTPAPEAKQLCEVTKLALDEAIKICRPGVPYSMIGRVINDIADQHKYGVIKEYVGHGVGRVFHSAPTIMHARNMHGGKMQVNETFTIEPMLVQGGTKCITWPDKWTVLTADGGYAAQYEHTLLITPEGCEMLTAWPSQS